MGIDEVGIDKVGIDEVGINRSILPIASLYYIHAQQLARTCVASS